jgi:anthranilate/para-aminobenzoate synthase component I
MQALLDFENQIIFAKDPVSYLEVRDGDLFQNNICIGAATDLGKALYLRPSSGFFPAWIGFVGYEYARYFGLCTQESDSNFPDAAFYLFDRAQPCPELPRQVEREQECRSLFEKSAFLNAVRDIQEEILSGDVYQVNLSRQFELTGVRPNPFQVYAQLKQSNPSPFMGVLQHPEWSIVSGSPERLFKLHNNEIWTRPIAGTRSIFPGAEQELLSNTKECAEHAMLVDLMRNDLAKICETGSVHVPEQFVIERYRHVLHLVSEVRGRTHADLSAVFKAIFPGGTITGAPKENVMRSIARHELSPRGPYTGSFGYVSSGYGADFNILIRSLYIGRQKTYFSAGAGIVIGSNPEAEFEETEHKIKQFKKLFANATGLAS